MTILRGRLDRAVEVRVAALLEQRTAAAEARIAEATARQVDELKAMVVDAKAAVVNFEHGRVIDRHGDRERVTDLVDALSARVEMLVAGIRDEIANDRESIETLRTLVRAISTELTEQQRTESELLHRLNRRVDAFESGGTDVIRRGSAEASRPANR